MTRTIFRFLLFLIVMVSCVRKKDTFSQLKKKAINLTTADLFYAVETNAGSDSAYIYSQDSAEFIFDKKGKFRTNSWFISDLFIDEVTVTEERIYNLSDTSRFIFNPISAVMSVNDSLYDKNISRNSTGDELEQYHSQVLTVTDTLLTIFKKDYTMLEKFKEYYQK